MAAIEIETGAMMLEMRGAGVKLGFLISPSVDGEIGAMLVRKLGVPGGRERDWRRQCGRRFLGACAPWPDPCGTVGDI